MREARPRSTENRRSLRAAAVVGALALSGVTCIGLAVAGHWRPQPHQPPLSQAAVASGPGLRPAGADASAPPSRPRWTVAGIPAVRGPVLPASAPTALEIASIGVQTTLVRVGLTRGGALQVPAGSHYDQAAWYRYSPTPGSVGPAVIVGHIDSSRGASVFFRLGSMKPGDVVRVTRADHSVAVFEVDGVARYRKDQFPTKRVYGNTDHAALRLISCGGPFDRSSGHYRDNIVVSASLTVSGA
jgi:hypothetical protein